MARPKSDPTQAPTRDRLLEAAAGLFADRGYEGVSVRDLTRSVGLNEAVLYHYFRDKADLFDQVLGSLAADFLEPGLADPALLADREGPDLLRILAAGARGFFGRVTVRDYQVWRIAVQEQYRHPAARDLVRRTLLEAPRAYFAVLLEELGRRGLLRTGTDPRAGAVLLSGLFFEFSFGANLAQAWDGPGSFDSGPMGAGLAEFARAFGTGIDR